MSEATLRRTSNGTNLVDQVYEQIVGLLTERLWTRAEDLSDLSLAQKFGVSRTPVRMALARLESEGLVQRVPGRGWFASPLTTKDIEEIFDLKVTLEPFAARQAAEKITPDLATALLAIIEDMKRAADDKSLEEWSAADMRFHDLLFRIAGNDRLRQFVTRLSSQWYRYRVGYITPPGQMDVLWEEHRVIAEAIAAGNPDLAADNSRKHIQHTRTRLLEITRSILAPYLGVM
jgi:DNA-binding GntR family transcriptional regulator